MLKFHEDIIKEVIEMLGVINDPAKSAAALQQVLDLKNKVDADIAKNEKISADCDVKAAQLKAADLALHNKSVALDNQSALLLKKSSDLASLESSLNSKQIELRDRQSDLDLLSSELAKESDSLVALKQDLDSKMKKVLDLKAEFQDKLDKLKQLVG